jgi:hypothetical protein
MELVHQCYACIYVTADCGNSKTAQTVGMCVYAMWQGPHTRKEHQGNHNIIRKMSSGIHIMEYGSTPYVGFRHSYTEYT